MRAKRARVGFGGAKRSAGDWLALALVGPFILGGCSNKEVVTSAGDETTKVTLAAGTSTSDATCEAAEPISQQALELIELTRATFQFVTATRPGWPYPPMPGEPLPGTRFPVIRDSDAACLVRVDDRLIPVSAPAPVGGEQASVSLPLVGSGPVHITDSKSDVSMAIELVGAAPSRAEVAAGYVVYRDVLGEGIHVIHRPSHNGTEDFVSCASPPPGGGLAYRVSLGIHVAGLRLLDDTVELLDTTGTPRLRLGAPLVVSTDGKSTRTHVSFEGCIADSNPAAPWGRSLTEPGSRTCTLNVSWPPSLTYPLLVDPPWTATGGMAFARAHHAAVRLGDGRVLVTGGSDPADSDLSSSELFDPATGTWALTAPMPAVSELPFLAPRVGRTLHTAVVLADGDVLVAGGANVGFATATALRYRTATATWSQVGSMSFDRFGHTLTRSLDSRVVVAGGLSNRIGAEVGQAEIFNAGPDVWGPAGSMTGRSLHAASLMNDGRVLISGGVQSLTSLASAEIFSFSTNAWSAAPSLAAPRAWHTQTTLGNGDILVAGGVRTLPGDTIRSAELFPRSALGWRPAAEPLLANAGHTATILTDGRVLLVGNGAPTQAYRPTENAWQFTGALGMSRDYGSRTLLANGDVLAAGGRGDSPPVASSELFHDDTGQPCVTSSDCGSLSCSDGVCCDTACGGSLPSDCVACARALGGVADGFCSAVPNARACTLGAASGTCQAGTCSLTACGSGFADCDGSPINGCETNLGTSNTNCGACGALCLGASQACSSGLCCIIGNQDCDGNPANACEANFQTDPNNCGGCGRICGALHTTARSCIAGDCVAITCAQGFADCDGNKFNGCEVDSFADPANCGACNRVCSSNHVPSPTCNFGTCAGACDPGYVDCDGNRQTNGCEALAVDNCGGCGRVCSTNHVATRTCAAGTCGGTCEPGWDNCFASPIDNGFRADGCETNVGTDVMNCGRCGLECSQSTLDGVACVAGQCTGTCKPGFADCNGDLHFDGCEVNLLTDADNCGACGASCSGSNIAFRGCSGGQCKPVCAGQFEDCNGDARTDGCEKSPSDGDFCGACACDDGNGCTADFCSPGVGCLHNPVGFCGDGWCSVGEDSCACPSDCPDRDGDGLADSWEIEGVDVDCDGVGDHPLSGADPDVKDLYLEIDYMFAPDAPRAPSPQQVAELVAPFAAQGINLHVEVSDAIPEAELVTAGAPPAACAAEAVNFWDIRRTHMDPAHRGAYRYALVAKAWASPGTCGANTSGGLSVGRAAFMVACGGGSSPSFASPCGGPFSHELGHTLGLGHGGGDGINGKQNYFSVMSRFGGALVNPAFRNDFSRRALDPISELALVERDGISSPEPANLRYSCALTCPTIEDCNRRSVGCLPGTCGTLGVHCPCQFVGTQLGVTTGGVDWNCNGDPNESNPVRQNLTRLCLDPALCDLSTDSHPGHDDWAEIVPCMGGSGWAAFLPVPDVPPGEVEATTEEGLRRAFALEPTLPVAIAIQPDAFELGTSDILRVALLSGPGFDPGIVDPLSLVFALASPVAQAVEDVNGDGALDLVGEFVVADLNLIPSSSRGTLGGSTFERRLVSGAAPIHPLPPAHNLPPLVECASLVVPADSACQSRMSINAGSRDPDGDVLLVQESPPPPYALGTTAVSLQVNDDLHAGSCGGTIEVVDQTAPALSCPEVSTAECESGLAGRAFFSVAAEDNCGSATVTCSPASGSAFPVGETPVVCTARDAAGNESSCGFFVVVRDSTPPSLQVESPTITASPQLGPERFHVERCVQAASDSCSGPLDVSDRSRITRLEWLPDGPAGPGKGRGPLSAARHRFAASACEGLRILDGSSVLLPRDQAVIPFGGSYRIHFDIDDGLGNRRSSTCDVGVAGTHPGPRHAASLGCAVCLGEDCGDCPSPEELCHQ